MAMCEEPGRAGEACAEKPGGPGREPMEPSVGRAGPSRGDVTCRDQEVRRAPGVRAERRYVSAGPWAVSWWAS